ncbi:helix-turn-helix transcriptional regulator [Burkholderia paludis]|uniref:helix-turn-helix transcriptional regulator n=1 Tax=Burkholderia paludis TaxID=1506587 RepID=UPI001F1CB7FA|nr:helix-turn-helix transcriptional regulator [Burkholderia paludis]
MIVGQLRASLRAKVVRIGEEIRCEPDQPADLCRLVGMSERATIDAFRSQFSRTPAQYIIERRLERARWMLEHTSDSILSIALDCGFGTQSYLSTAIKRHFGATPRELRMRAASARRSGTSDGQRDPHEQAGMRNAGIAAFRRSNESVCRTPDAERIADAHVAHRRRVSG